MDRKLLILGIIRAGDIHVYELNKFLEAHAEGVIKLKKSTVYSLLERMEKQGFIRHYEDQVGNRPTRRVYALTEAGEVEFQRLLRARAGTFVSPELHGVISLDFLSLLPLAEATELLKQRRAEAVLAAGQYAADHTPPQTEGDADPHPLAGIGLEYLRRFYNAEVEFLDEVLLRVSSQEETDIT
jgi:DNA-binding PadR family transcriptional regulator